MSTAALCLAIEAETMIERRAAYEDEIEYAQGYAARWRFENLIRRRVNFDLAALECVREIAQWVNE
jgi:hypothetical protein